MIDDKMLYMMPVLAHQLCFLLQHMDNPLVEESLSDASALVPQP